jgi:predicted DNA-binding ArsR family transcriptional regulator
MAEHAFDIQIQKNYQLKIELGGYEKLHLMQKYKECRLLQGKMNIWREREDVPEADKKAASHIYLNLLVSVSLLRDIIGQVGITQEEIDAYMKIPF